MDTVLVTQYSANVINSGLDEDVLIGEIHSIFEKSLNLKFDFGLVNIIKEDYQQLPFSIEIEEEILRCILSRSQVGDKVVLDKLNKSLIFENINIEIIFVSKPYNCILNKCVIDKEKFNDNFAKLEKFIDSVNIQNGFGISNKLFLKYVDDITHNNKKTKQKDMHYRYIDEDTLKNNMEIEIRYFINELINSSNENDKTKIFDYFIGRGIGLTPSGDDLMLGLISMLKVANRDSFSKYLSEYLETNGTKRTTDISLEYLKYALDGSVGKNVKNICEEATYSDCNMVKYLDKLSKKGHSSGMDTILGIYLAMTIINKFN